MIYGIGTDIIRIARIEAAVARNGERFAAKILGPEEMQIYLERKSRAEARGLRFLATRFAAKEAFSKAIGLGLTKPMTWPAAQVLSEAGGKPVMVTSGALHDFMQRNRFAAKVSLTDEVEYAVAFVIIEQV